MSTSFAATRAVALVCFVVPVGNGSGSAHGRHPCSNPCRVVAGTNVFVVFVAGGGVCSDTLLQPVVLQFCSLVLCVCGLWR